MQGARRGRDSDAQPSREGRLVVVGTPIGHLGDLSPRAVAALGEADVIACEDTRVARRLLSAAGVRAPRLASLHGHNEARQIAPLLALLDNGATVVLTSDAGMPAISDPGERLIAAAVAHGVHIEIVPGPSAAVAALVASGLPTARFTFEGFLPRSGGERRARLDALGSRDMTSVIFEAPHRLARTVADLATHAGGDRRCAVVWDVTKLFEGAWRGSLAEAAAHFASAEIRGEYVVVVEGAAPVAEPDDDAIDRAVQQRLAADGADARALTREIAEELQVPRKRVYASVLRQRGRAPR